VANHVFDKQYFPIHKIAFITKYFYPPHRFANFQKKGSAGMAVFLKRTRSHPDPGGFPADGEFLPASSLTAAATAMISAETWFTIASGVATRALPGSFLVDFVCRCHFFMI
jgi:hypothetical protein